MLPLLLALLVVLGPEAAPAVRPCTPLLRGARVVACHGALPAGARLDSPQGGVLTSRPPRPARDASALSPPPSREPREHGDEAYEAHVRSGASSRQRFLGGQR